MFLRSAPTNTPPAPKGDELYNSIISAYSPVKETESHTVDTLLLVKATMTILPVYECLFGNNFLATLLKKDLTGSQSKVEASFLKAQSEKSTVDKFIKHELQLNGLDKCRKQKDSGVLGLLWMNRALSFIVTFMEYCIVSPEYASRTSKDAANAAYSKILKPYHGTMSSIAVSSAFNICPSREDLIKTLGFENASVAKAKTESLLETIRPVVESVSASLEAHNCNFDDKA